MSMERRSEAPDATIPSGCESLAHLTWHEDEVTKIGPKVVKPCNTLRHPDLLVPLVR